jgi:hypothetical protein
MPSTNSQEAVHEVLARLLAVGDDVDARVLLLLQPEQRRVALRRRVRAFGAPLAARACRLGEPAGLGRLPAIVVSNICVASFAVARRS